MDENSDNKTWDSPFQSCDDEELSELFHISKNDKGKACDNSLYKEQALSENNNLSGNEDN